MDHSGSGRRADASYDTLLVPHLALIDSVVRHVVRRHGMRAADAEDFGASVRLKLIENDCAVLRKFAGRASLRTYLTTVVQRVFVDHCIARWGKWRPSQEARRLGWIAVHLECLLVKQEMRFEEACEVLRTNFDVQASESELYELSLRLPVRAVRRFVSVSALAEVSADPGEFDRSTQREGRLALSSRLRESIASAASTLPTLDRLVLKLRFEDGLTVAQVARATGEPQKQLYRRLAQLLMGLRTTLEADGFTKAHIEEVLADPEATSEVTVFSSLRQGKGLERPSV